MIKRTKLPSTPRCRLFYNILDDSHGHAAIPLAGLPTVREHNILLVSWFATRKIVLGLWCGWGGNGLKNCKTETRSRKSEVRPPYCLSTARMTTSFPFQVPAVLPHYLKQME